MSKILSFILLLFMFVFTACSSHDDVLAPNQKSFEEEDRLIVFALYAKQKGDANSAIALYELLYEKSERLEYRDEVVMTMLQSGQFDRALKKIETYEENMDEDILDIKLQRQKISALIGKKDYDLAKKYALALVEQTKEAYDYQQVASLYMVQQRYEIALKYFQSAYKINYDEQILDKLVIILYVNLNKKAEAISYLETHMRLNGCSQVTCVRLASFYSEENNVDGMLSVYTRLYDNTKDDKFAHTLIKLYKYKKDIISLIQFLEESGVDDVLLLQLYTSTKNYARVVSLSDKLYEETSDTYYLGQSAIFEYEGATKKDEKVIDSVMHKLEKVLENSDDAMYMNYYGYLLIDHNLDVEKGINYVNKALKVEPESAFYLDSLAWGYYKQGRCTEALKIMKKAKKNLGKDDPEITKHINKIHKCIKKGKKK